MSEATDQRRIAELEAELSALRASIDVPYRAIMNDMTELVVRWKPDGTRVFVNDAYCRLFGQPREQLIGTTFWPLITDEDRACVEQHIGRLNVDRPISTDVHRAIRPDGTVFWMEWTDRAIFGDDGSVIEYQSVGRDITERMELQQQLRRIEQADALARASASIAHDMANLLFVISGQIQEARANPNPECFDTAEEAVRRGSELVRQLQELRYGRLVEPVRLDINDRIIGAHGLLRVVAGHVVVESKLSPDPCVIRGDPTQIDQILLNLVRNAAEASPDGATVVLETRHTSSDSDIRRHRWPKQPPRDAASCASQTTAAASAKTSSRRSSTQTSRPSPTARASAWRPYWRSSSLTADRSSRAMSKAAPALNSRFPR